MAHQPLAPANEDVVAEFLADLNNDLADCFHRWYPAFTHRGGPADIEVDLAA